MNANYNVTNEPTCKLTTVSWVTTRLVRERAVEELSQVRSPNDAYQIVRGELQDATQERLLALALDTKNRVLGICEVSRGGLNAATVDLRVIYRFALLSNAASIILAHNHPSGEPTPSPEDILITREIIEAGRILDIDVLDHIVVGHNQFRSIRELNGGTWR